MSYVSFSHTNPDTGVFFVSASSAAKATCFADRSREWNAAAPSDRGRIVVDIISVHDDLSSAIRAADAARAAAVAAGEPVVTRNTYDQVNPPPEAPARRQVSREGLESMAASAAARVDAAWAALAPSPEAAKLIVESRLGRKRWDDDGKPWFDRKGKLMCVDAGLVFESKTHAAKWLRENGHKNAAAMDISAARNKITKTCCGYRWATVYPDDDSFNAEPARDEQPRELRVKTYSEEARQRISAANLGRTRTEAQRQRMSESRLGGLLKCVETGRVFRSQSEAVEWVRDNINPRAVSPAITAARDKPYRSAYGYTWVTTRDAPAPRP